MIVYHVVIDTNVVISALLKNASVPRTLLNMVADGRIVPVYNQTILDEYLDVMQRRKFSFSDKEIQGVISLIKNRGIEYQGVVTDLEEFPDKKDIVFYEVTMDSMQYQETRLVTGNLKHFPQKTFIVNPRELLDIIIREME